MKSRSILIIAAMLTAAVSAQAALPPELLDVQREWAKIKYESPEKERGKGLERLAAKAHTLSGAYPQQAEPLVWEAIVKASLAGEKGAFGGALGYVKEARKLLEKAEAIDPLAMNGSVYTTLGSLYYQVPGWPLGFGDDKKAREYLEKALNLNPDGIDPNYFYGDFLLDQGDYAGAVKALEKALAAPPRPDRPVADAGRRGEIEAALAVARKKLGTK